MEKRITQLENELKYQKLENTHANQRVASSLEGMSSQLAEINRNTRDSLAKQETTNSEEIDALREEFAETRKDLGMIGKKLMYYSGGIAACGVIGVALIGIVVYVFTSTNAEHSERMAAMKLDYDRRLDIIENRFEKAENRSDEQLKTLHRIEILLARRGEPDRGSYSGEQKK